MRLLGGVESSLLCTLIDHPDRTWVETSQGSDLIGRHACNAQAYDIGLGDIACGHNEDLMQELVKVVKVFESEVVKCLLGEVDD